MIRSPFFWCPSFVVAFISIAVASGRLGGFRGSIEPSSVTVSGFSSGGYFATQFHVAYSSIFRGAAIFSAGPYLCAYPGKYDLIKVARCLLFPWTFFGNAGKSVKYARKLEAEGSIDALQNLANDRVFLHYSILDPIQKFPGSKMVIDFYENFMPSEQIFLHSSILSGHGIPTVNYGYPCLSPISPSFILNCGYNGAYEALNFLYDGSLNPPSAHDVQQNVFRGEVVAFDQADFLPQGRTRDELSLAKKGYVYIPENCQAADSVCKLNVFFHGCLQGATLKVGTDVVVNAGFAQVADANDIVMLFPQIIKRKKPHNPICCWDWYGYIDKKVFGDRRYATKSGPQMVAVYNMMQSLMTA